MSAATIVMGACAAVYLVIGASYVRLATIRRLGREYGFFAALAFSLTIASVGAAIATIAVDTAMAERAMRIQSIGISLTLGAFGNFVYPNVQRPTGLPGHAATAFAVLSTIFVLGGLAYDPNVTIPASHAVGPGSYPQPGTTPLGVVLSLVGLLIAGWITIDVADVERTSRSGRIVLLAVLVALSSWTMGGVLVAGGYAVGPWFALTLAPFLAALAAALLQRWVDVDADVAQRSIELEAAYRELKDAQNELVRREQLAAVGELSAVIAHEVRNPLAVLKNAVSGLRRDTLAPDLRDTLHGILDQETDRLNRLVRDLLAYARPIHVTHVEVAIRDLLGRIVDQARNSDRATSGLVDVELDLDVPATIRADPDLIERALTHVVENAFQAMPNGGKLAVLGRRLQEDGVPKLAISVLDSGEGMDTLVRSRAKEPFFTTRQEGTGLGLAIVERVTASHGGRLELDRNGDGGTKVTLVIPEIEVRHQRSDPPRRSLLTPV